MSQTQTQSHSQTKSQTKTQILEAHESHEIFFKTITRNKLNELLNRVITGYLKNQINSVLHGFYVKVNFDTELCNGIYIHYHDINDKDIGHISFHLSKDNSLPNSFKRKGMFHVKNQRNRNRCYTLRVTRKNALYNMKVNSPLKMKSDLEYCVNSTLKILNDYTEPNSQYFLGNRLTWLSNKDNVCLVKIAGPKFRSRFNNTIRQPRHSISISKQYSKKV